MAVVCPTVMAAYEAEYKAQMEKVAPFAHRIQVDLTDGVFAGPKTIDPKDVWWPAGVKADIHLMYQEPEAAVKELLNHQPHLIIIHLEANGKFDPLARLCRQANVKIGIAILANSRVEPILPVLKHIDHALIFSGDLGKFGGRANLDLLRKVHLIKQNNPHIEIGWDGGINSHNTSQLVFGGVDVLNVGSFIQKADDPERSFRILQRIADETGTT